MSELTEHYNIEERRTVWKLDGREIPCEEAAHLYVEKLNAELAQLRAQLECAKGACGEFEPRDTGYREGDTVVWFDKNGVEIDRTKSNTRIVDLNSFAISESTRILRRARAQVEA